jgi:hypothetical protein
MRFALLTASLGIAMLFSYRRALAQDSATSITRLTSFPTRLLGRIDNKAAWLNKQLDKQTEKYLNQLAAKETQLKKKITKIDPAGAKQLFANDPQQQYALWLQSIKGDTSTKSKPLRGEYYPYMDSLQTSLSFLKQDPQMLDPSKVVPSDIQTSINNLRVLQAKMQDADQIKQYIQQRKEQINLYLSRYTQLPPGIMNAYNGYKEQLYYYSQQVKEYKDMINDPDKMMSAALRLLNKIPAFTDFFKNNAMLARIFNLPGVYNPSSAIGNGLPTRDQVISAFQGQMGKGGPDLTSVVQQNVQSAQGSTSQLTSKLSAAGNGNGVDPDVPDFKPNGQKTKSIFKRLIYGVDLQTVSSSYFFPATTDIGLSLGYKLDDNNSLGIGASYKIGWGQDIGHIKTSGQGASLRSFADLRIKKSLFASGGFEYNYQQPFDPRHIPGLANWQQSGLLGLSKIIPLGTKILKTTKIQILWDFLSYQQIPRAQPFKFRIGYSF